MKKTITKDEFKREFKGYNRENQYSSYALEKIFDYLEEFEEATGEEIELDVIALCLYRISKHKRASKKK